MVAAVPCDRDKGLEKKIGEFAEVLKTATHALGTHGLSEEDFYQSGILEGAIQRIREQYPQQSMRSAISLLEGSRSCRTAAMLRNGSHLVAPIGTTTWSSSPAGESQ